jgi:aspartyl-tRNA(Asn)/glutamyl-tRNA(Gln) amidotransferase subunit C
MASIDIEHLARLAQLQLTEDEHTAVAKDLGRIIDMIDQMQAMTTEDVEPLAHPLDAKLRLRKDEVTEVVDRERYQRGAPAIRDGLYLVPRVVE